MSAERCHTIAELRAAAQRRLPIAMFDFLDGGVEDERTLRENVSAWSDYALVPTVLNDVSSIDMRSTIFGKPVSMPLMLSPTGASGLFHYDAEGGVARAASKAGILYGISSMANTTLKDIAAAAPGPKMFQTLPFKDRGLLKSLVEGCREAGYDAFCITVDSATAGNRERDRRNGLLLPPKFTLKSIMSFVTHPSWSLSSVFRSSFDLANFPDEKTGSPAERMHRMFNRALTWADVEWLAGEWNGPFMVKGLVSPEDARRAVASGATAVGISNHGGRQLEDTIAPVRQVPRIRDAVGGSIEIVVDGGIRRGTDVVKALALGANAVGIGRPYLYGLGAFGEVGVDRAISILRTELERNMALLGCASVAAIRPEHVLTTKGQSVSPR